MKRWLPVLLSAAFLAASVNIYAADTGLDNPQTFWDVPKEHWAYDYIEELTQKGVINGNEDGSFWPEANVTRAEGAKMLATAMNLAADDNSVKFYDMSGHWANAYVNAIIDYWPYFEGDAFLPDQPLTREEMAAIMVSLRGLDLSYDYNRYIFFRFTDLDGISYVLAPYVASAVKYGLISGFDDNTFKGRDTLTKAEAAALICRAFGSGSITTIGPSSVRRYTAKETPLPPLTDNPDSGYIQIAGSSRDLSGNIYFVHTFSGYSDDTYKARLYKRDPNGAIEELWDLATVTAVDNGTNLQGFRVSDICYDIYQGQLLIIGSFSDADMINYDLDKYFLFALKDGNMEMLSSNIGQYDKMLDALPAYYLMENYYQNGKCFLVAKDLSSVYKVGESNMYSGDNLLAFENGVEFYLFEADLNLLQKSYYSLDEYGEYVELYDLWDGANTSEYQKGALIDDNICIIGDSENLYFYNFAGRRINTISRDAIDTSGTTGLSKYDMARFILKDSFFDPSNNDLIMIDNDSIYHLEAANFGISVEYN